MPPRNTEIVVHTGVTPKHLIIQSSTRARKRPYNVVQDSGSEEKGQASRPSFLSSSLAPAPAMEVPSSSSVAGPSVATVSAGAAGAGVAGAGAAGAGEAAAGAAEAATSVGMNSGTGGAAAPTASAQGGAAAGASAEDASVGTIVAPVVSVPMVGPAILVAKTPADAPCGSLATASLLDCFFTDRAFGTGGFFGTNPDTLLVGDSFFPLPRCALGLFGARIPPVPPRFLGRQRTFVIRGRRLA